MRIGIVESFYTGSHKYWADQLIQLFPKWHLFSIPGKHWKWRMQGSAIELANQVNSSGINFDKLIVSSLINLPLFKSLLKNPTELIIYFHENQFYYPKSKLDTDIKNYRDNHYGFLNYTSALVSDKIVFNSEFNRKTFLDGTKELLNQMPDYRSLTTIDDLEGKSSVIGIGIEGECNHKEKPVILWNHRWENDKNPDDFIKLLNKLKEENWELIVCGKGSEKHNVKEILNPFESRIIHLGYCSNKNDYYQLLKTASILPVTSNHDFFGISVLEAIKNGCHPILPNKMCYPEHIPNSLAQEILYDDETDLLLKTKRALELKTDLKPLKEYLLKYNLDNIKKSWLTFLSNI